MNIHQVKTQGKTFTFHVIKNITTPCSQCGVPACGKEDILWYEHEQQRIAIIFDGGYFDLAGQVFLSEYLKTMDYLALPNFMKQWNESKGWEACWDYEGYPLDIDDFIKSIELLERSNTEKWITPKEIEAMKKLAQAAMAKNAILKIVRG